MALGHKKTHRAASAAALIGTALLVAACGSSSSSTAELRRDQRRGSVSPARIRGDGGDGEEHARYVPDRRVGSRGLHLGRRPERHVGLQRRLCRRVAAVDHQGGAERIRRGGDGRPRDDHPVRRQQAGDLQGAPVVLLRGRRQSGVDKGKQERLVRREMVADLPVRHPGRSRCGEGPVVFELVRRVVQQRVQRVIVWWLVQRRLGLIRWRLGGTTAYPTPPAFGRRGAARREPTPRRRRGRAREADRAVGVHGRRPRLLRRSACARGTERARARR